MIGLTSVQAAKAKGLDDRALGKLVGASSLLQGSVQRAGDRIRIIAHLVNADNSVQLWSGTYNFDFKDIFAVQDTMAKAIAAELRASLGGEAPVARAATTNPEAHTLFLRGLYLWNRRTGKTLTAAISLFGEAAAKDTTYAEAYAYIGMGEALRTTYTDTTGWWRTTSCRYPAGNDVLIGRGHELAAHHMEIRGIGLIDIPRCSASAPCGSRSASRSWCSSRTGRRPRTPTGPGSRVRRR